MFDQVFFFFLGSTSKIELKKHLESYLSLPFLRILPSCIYNALFYMTAGLCLSLHDSHTLIAHLPAWAPHQGTATGVLEGNSYRNTRNLPALSKCASGEADCIWQHPHRASLDSLVSHPVSLKNRKVPHVPARKVASQLRARGGKEK